MMMSLLSFSFRLLLFSSLHLHNFISLSTVESVMSMKSRRRASSSSPTSTVTYTFRNDNSTPPSSKEIPIKSPDGDAPSTPITVHLHDHHHHSSAAALQAAYRSYVVRRLVKKIAAVKTEVDRMERLIQRQETVDALRIDDKEKLKVNEMLMRLLLELDSVPGFDPAVRDLRRSLSRRIVGLQEIVDGICRSGAGMEMEGWDWDEVIGKIEEEVCRDRGGDELERFCALHLGFRCLRRFLRE